MPRAPLNILYIHSHDTGRYIQPYGYAVPTPALQRFAEQGVLFRNAFCVNPTCSASRTGLLTGQYPHEAGMIGLAHRGSKLNDPSRHLAQFLSRNGYHTALTGVQHEARHDEVATLGYRSLLDQTLQSIQAGGGDETSAARAAAFIEQPREEPFFLACGFSATHRMGGKEGWHNAPGPQGDPRYVRVPAPLPDTPATRTDFADYIVAAQRLDRCMQTVFDAIDRAGRRDDTLVICTTDHGIAFPGMKCSLTDHGTGVLLILRGPGFEAGRVVDPMVTHLDLYPTLCELAGLEKPDWLRGASLVPLLNGAADRVHDAVFATVNYHAAYEPQRTVRTERHRYVRRWNVQPHPILPNCDNSATKLELLRHGWRSQAQREEALFDLAFDPAEACDLSTSAAHRPVLEQMRSRLATWMAQTNDPLLNGTVPAPPGLVVTPVDADSPDGKTRLG